MKVLSKSVRNLCLVAVAIFLFNALFLASRQTARSEAPSLPHRRTSGDGLSEEQLDDSGSGQMLELADLSIAILSWKSPKSLRNSLSSLRDSGLLEAVNETVIFFPEVQAADLDVLREFKRYRVSGVGSPTKLSPGRGFDKAVALTRAPLILYLEASWFMPPHAYYSSTKIISSGLHIVKTGNATVFRLRDTVASPVLPLCSQHDVRNMAELPQWFCDCAAGQVSHQLYGNDNVMEVFPAMPLWDCSAVDSPERVVCMSSAHCMWSNNPIIFSRNFYNDVLHSIMEKDPDGAENTHWAELRVSESGRKSPFVVAVPYSGVFTRHADLEENRPPPVMFVVREEAPYVAPELEQPAVPPVAEVQGSGPTAPAGGAPSPPAAPEGERAVPPKSRGERSPPVFFYYFLGFSLVIFCALWSFFRQGP